MQFDFATSNQIIFGRGKVKEIGGFTTRERSRAFVVYGSSLDRISQLSALLNDNKVSITRFSIPDELTIEDIRTGVNHCRQEDCDLVIALGGGSVIDTGMAIAVLATNEGDITE